MNKAYIIPSTLALFAIMGGALAFKVMRNGNPVWTTTTVYSANGTLYTRAGSATFCWTKTDEFFTLPPVGAVTMSKLTTIAPATLTYTLTRIGGTQTTTIPNFCTVTAVISSTRITAVD